MEGEQGLVFGGKVHIYQREKSDLEVRYTFTTFSHAECVLKIDQNWRRALSKEQERQKEEKEQAARLRAWLEVKLDPAIN